MFSGRKHTKGRTGFAAALALIGVWALGAAAPSQAAPVSFDLPDPGPSASASATGPGVLTRQDATLTTANRAAGMPTSTDPGRQLERVVVGIETYGQDKPTPSYFVDAKVELAGDPAGDPDAVLNLGFGHRSGANCSLAAVLSDETSPFGGTSYEFVGYNPDYFPTPSRPWDCVAVFLDDSLSGGAPTATYDALVGPLTDTRKSPRLSISRVTLLGRKQKKLKLVRGVPTAIEVKLHNSGEVPTGKLTIRGAGKGLRVAKRSLAALEGGRDGTVTLKVRLVGRQKRTKLRIVAGDGSVKASRGLRVRKVRPPKRPVAGRYRGSAGNVTFRVRRGRIVGWRGSMSTRCGGYPDPFTYSYNTYSFRTVKVPRNGIVQATERGDLYTATLELRIAGGKVTQGSFAYYGPDRCFAAASFKARRR